MRLQTFIPGTDLTFDVPLIDAEGTVLAQAGVEYRVLDANGVVLQDWLTLNPASVVAGLPGAPYIAQIPIPGTVTILSPEQPRDLRSVELLATTSTGLVPISMSFMVQGLTALKFGINTFITYSQAQLMLQDFADTQMPGWELATSRADCERALIQAHERILQLPVQTRLEFAQNHLIQDAAFISIFSGEANLLSSLTPEQLGQLRPTLQLALKKAQLVEADEILNGDVIAIARQSGLLSERVGESSQSFRASKPIEFSVGPRTMQYLTRWIRFGARLTRS